MSLCPVIKKYKYSFYSKIYTSINLKSYDVKNLLFSQQVYKFELR